jgi:hypothetical protein
LTPTCGVSSHELECDFDVIRYGKPSAVLLQHKQAFFKENDAKITEFGRLAHLYTSQPRRVECKNCEARLGETTFEKFGVEYVFCTRCGHLNGAHEDTNAFCEALYTEDEGRAYGSVYAAIDGAAYRKRVNDIYLPKALFLAEALKEQGEDPAVTRFVDMGAGSGYFVAALLAAGMSQVKGFEVSKSQVDLGNANLGRELLIRHRLSDVMGVASSLEADVVSLIGVLEHLQRPRDVLRGLKDNPTVRYLFLSLPLFSPSVFFEMVFPEVMPRQLVGAHTHLYTETSIDYLCTEFGFARKAEWWFGTDVVDLYRSVSVMLGKRVGSRNMVSVWDRIFRPVMDDVQLAMDRHRLASEVHLLLKVKG